MQMYVLVLCNEKHHMRTAIVFDQNLSGERLVFVFVGNIHKSFRTWHLDCLPN